MNKNRILPNDPWVTVWEPAKFAARLQAANASDEPILFAVDFESGHSMGDSKTTYFESMADVASFFLWQTGHPEFQVKQKTKDINLQNILL